MTEPIFGHWLGTRRKSLKLSQLDVATCLDIGVATLEADPQKVYRVVLDARKAQR